MAIGPCSYGAYSDYANADLNDPHVAIVGVDDPDTTDVISTRQVSTDSTVNSNFDAAGRLVVPMSYAGYTITMPR